MKKVSIIIFVLLLIGGGIGYYMFNKKPAKVEDIKAAAITADSLYGAFAANEAAANKTYLSKVFDVSGTVQEVSQNQDGQTVAILGVAADPLSGVQCTFRDKGVKLEVDQKAVVKGFCNGYTMTVILSDCILTN